MPIGRGGTNGQPGLAAVVNPAAGSGRALHRWARVERILAARGIPCTVLYSNQPGDITQLTKRVIAGGHRTILSVGGDGTLHEVVNGLFEDGAIHQDVRVGLIPAGTAVDFARNTDLDGSLLAAVERITRGVERRVDLGVARGPEEKIFVNFAETGIGGAVVRRASEFAHRMPGRAAFLLASLLAIRSYSSVQTRVIVDGSLFYEGPMVSVVAANGPYFGGGMKIAPRASVTDGLLDIVVLGDFSRGELVANVWKIYPGSHLAHSRVLWVTGKSVSVESRDRTQLDLDGELYGEGPYSFEIVPGGLRLLV